MARELYAALGFRSHTGWAVAVVATAGCELLERHRVACEPKATRFVYHKAAEKLLVEAGPFIAAARGEAVAAVGIAIANIIAATRGKGPVVRSACIPAGTGRLPDSLSEVLAVHSRIHMAEGVFYREALVEACKAYGLSVVRVPERDLWPRAAHALGWPETRLQDRIMELGRRLGPPWGEDQKLATLAAMIAAQPR
jgi:hypothetical protein